MPKIRSALFNGEYNYMGAPGVCPFCHKTIIALPVIAHKSKTWGEITFACPDPSCSHLFIGYFDGTVNTWTYQDLTSIGKIEDKYFSDNVKNVSSGFVQIYNEALVAESYNLHEICGVGYRKALEFLIKDYAILNHPSDKETIEKILLGKVISQFIDNKNIQAMAKRAAWLGNDETHYVKKWGEKDLNDLKLLIDITVHWIEMEILTQEYNDSMPN